MYRSFKIKSQPETKLNEFDTAIKNTQERLKETSDAIGNLKLEDYKIFTFLISDLADKKTRENIIENISKWENERGASKYLYFCRGKDFDKVLAYRLFSETKAAKKKQSLSSLKQDIF
jgi:hypothetical protein